MERPSIKEHSLGRCLVKANQILPIALAVLKGAATIISVVRQAPHHAFWCFVGGCSIWWLLISSGVFLQSVSNLQCKLRLVSLRWQIIHMELKPLPDGGTVLYKAWRAFSSNWLFILLNIPEKLDKSRHDRTSFAVNSFSFNVILYRSWATACL